MAEIPADRAIPNGWRTAPEVQSGAIVRDEYAIANERIALPRINSVSVSNEATLGDGRTGL